MTPMTDPWDERYIYLHENHRNERNVGIYTIHGSYGTGNLICDTSTIYHISINNQVLEVENLVFVHLQTRGIRKITLKKLVYDHIMHEF